MTAQTPADIISDEEIERVVDRFDRGPPPKQRTKYIIANRKFVAGNALKYAFGYATGSTAEFVLYELGLLRLPEKRSGHRYLTAKGMAYLRAVYGPAFKKIVEMAE
jgi:hypothetical protein